MLFSFGCSAVKVESFVSSEFWGQHQGLCLDCNLEGKATDNLLKRLTAQLSQLYNFLFVTATCSCGIKRMMIGFKCCCQPRMSTLYLTNAIDSVIEYYSCWNLKHLQDLTLFSALSTPRCVIDIQLDFSFTLSSFTNRSTSGAHSLATFCQDNSYPGLM